MSVLARRSKHRGVPRSEIFGLDSCLHCPGFWRLAFQAYPMVASLFYSFSIYDIPKAPVFIGLELHRHVP